MSILFKDNYNTDCNKLLYLVRYLKKEKGIDIRPKFIIGRHFPEYVEGILPSLLIDGNLYKGLNDIIMYYENKLHLRDLMVHSEQFRINNN